MLLVKWLPSSPLDLMGFQLYFSKNIGILLAILFMIGVMEFLNQQRLPSALNYTYIVLIPKVSQPKKITEFRPISLCNVIYKLVSKAIANQIKPILNMIISIT